MKITKFLLLSLIVTILSCSKDEDPLPTTEGLVGTWSMTALNYKGSTTTTAMGVTLKADFTGTGKDMDFTTTFTTNPNNVTSEGSYTILLTTTMLGQTTTDEYYFEEVLTDGTWTLSGKTLSVTNDYGTQSAIITKQTSNLIEMRIDLNTTESDSGVTVTTKVQAVYTFEK